jgi:putative DNA primase/helicase
MVAASESRPTERLDAAKINAVTGGSAIYCAFKHHDLFSYQPQFKIWLSSNYPVNADPDDEAVWGRIRIVNFTQSHLGNEDKLLKEHLKDPEMLEVVLAWAVAGAMKWYALGEKGLSESEESIRVKREQREGIDYVQMWLDECCILGDGKHALVDIFTPNSELYTSYESWCKQSGAEQHRAKGFSQALIKKGLRADRSNTGARGFRGVKVKN